MNSPRKPTGSKLPTKLRVAGGLLVTAVVLTIEIFHLVDAKYWLPGTFYVAGSSKEIKGIVLDQWALVILLVICSFWVYNHIQLIIDEAAGLKDAIEGKRGSYEKNLNALLTSINATLGRSRSPVEKVIEPKVVVKVASASVRATDDEDFPTSIQERVRRLMQDASDALSKQRYSLIPWTIAQFEEYPNPQYRRVNCSIRATNIGSIEDFFGNDAVYLDELKQANQRAIEAGVKIQRIFVFDLSKYDRPTTVPFHGKPEPNESSSKATWTEGDLLLHVIREMLKIKVKVYCVRMSTAYMVFNGEPKDFSIFESLVSGRVIKEAAVLGRKSYFMQDGAALALPRLTVTEEVGEVADLEDKFEQLLKHAKELCEPLSESTLRSVLDKRLLGEH